MKRMNKENDVDSLIGTILNGPRPLPLSAFNISMSFTVKDAINFVRKLPPPDNEEISFPIKWINEDEIPSVLLKTQYLSMYKSSKVIDGVRMFPYFESRGKKFYLSGLEEEENEKAIED